MRACWMFMMLLSCRLSHTTKSHDVCACKDQLKKVCVPAGDDVPVPCPKLTGEHMMFNLFKDDEVIYNHTCKEQPPNCNPRYTRAGVEVPENTDNKSFSFMLTKVNSSSYGFYGCEGIRMYPPPYIKSTLWILLLVEGHECNFHKDDSPLETSDQKDGFLWIWILGLALLCTYCLIITIIVGIIWVKRSSDFQSDYINTKPKAHKDRKKKRGVQIPIPRHF